MTSSKIHDAAKVAADWWAEQLRVPPVPAIVEPSIDELMHKGAPPPDPMEGSWPSEVDLFRDAVFSGIVAQWRGMADWEQRNGLFVTNDYNPSGILRDALAAARIERRDPLPWKTNTRVVPEKVEISQEGRPRQTIEVNEG